MKQYHVTGMSCSACSSHVEKAVTNIDGVQNVSVNLLTNTMSVEGTASDKEIIDAVINAGYGAITDDSENKKKNIEDKELDKEFKIMKKRLISSIVFIIPLIYFSMGHNMLNWPLPSFFEKDYISIGLIQLILNTIIIVINQKFFVVGIRGFIKKTPNMDTLVAFGSGAAYIYSLVELFYMSNNMLSGDFEVVISLSKDLYFDSSAMILTLITLGKMLEEYSKGKTTNALKALMDMTPKKATIIIDGKELTVLVEEVKKGDIFVVKPGESIPVDGKVIEGTSAVDESLLTGESIPVDKEKGDNVSAATISQSGFLKCEAVNVGEDTALSHIIKMINDASATKAPIAKIADKVSGIFVPIVIIIAIITIIAWQIVSKDFSFALARGISVLVISCPCALGLATPVAIMVGNGIAARNGVLFKNAVTLEETGKSKIIALDKTGTITKGEPIVTDFFLSKGISETDFFEIAYSIEKMSEHPLARAIVDYSIEYGIDLKAVVNFEVLAGNGIKAEINNEKYIGGNLNFIKNHETISKEIEEKAKEFSLKGNTIVLFAKEGEVLGILAIADAIKPDSREAISELKNMGIKVVMLTGDNQYTAKAIGSLAGVDEVISEVLPEEKNNVIENLKKTGKTIMVGDGINDALALTTADIGMAIGAGTDVAISAADIVLMKSSIMDVGVSIRLSRLVIKTIHQNLFWAFIYNIIGIPLAAGVWIHLTGWTLNPMFGAAAMSLSSFFVVSNALRMNVNKINRKNQDTNFQSKIKKGDKKMEKIIIITGMMCGHCEARVKKSLEALSEVDEVIANHEKGTAIVKLNKDISNDVLRRIVEEQDYKVNNII